MSDPTINDWIEREDDELEDDHHALEESQATVAAARAEIVSMKRDLAAARRTLEAIADDTDADGFELRQRARAFLAPPATPVEGMTKLGTNSAPPAATPPPAMSTCTCPRGMDLARPIHGAATPPPRCQDDDHHPDCPAGCPAPAGAPPQPGEAVNADEWETVRRLIDTDGARAKALRLALFQMRDSREVTEPAGFTLTVEAKARLYDIHQHIIRAAIAADDRAMEAPGKPCETCGGEGVVAYSEEFPVADRPCPSCTPGAK